MRMFGWTAEQWAYAKQRHKLHGNPDLSADSDGMLLLLTWWRGHSWPDPLSVRLEGVVLESDNNWAAKAIHSAMVFGRPNDSLSRRR